MDLHIKDRIYIQQILPAQNSFMDYNLKRDILKKTELTKKDMEDYSIEENKDAGNITWDSRKDMETPLSVEFTKQETDYLKRACESIAASAYPDDLWVTVEKIYDSAKK